MAQESAFSHFADKPLPCGQKPFQGVVLRRVFLSVSSPWLSARYSFNSRLLLNKPGFPPFFF